MTDITWKDEVEKLLRDGEKARKALFAALDAETTTRVECECGRKFNAVVKDTTNAVRAAEIWFRQGAELAKHLERLHEKEPEENHRPLANLSHDEVIILRHERAEAIEGTRRINARLRLYDAVVAVLAGDARQDALGEAWEAYNASDPFPGITPVTTDRHGVRLTPLTDKVFGNLSNRQLVSAIPRRSPKRGELHSSGRAPNDNEGVGERTQTGRCVPR